ncbi:MAG: aldo/keto reductase, partial [Proteobacteria bacterium]|nr:aldo/keto reductase [Pseudomonadota bacterium]
FQGGVREFDTAQDYGDAESVLGAVFTELGIEGEVRVITKPDPGLDHTDPEALRSCVQASLDRLNIPRLHGLLLHREASLEDWERGLGDGLAALVIEGLVERVGVSVYSPAAALKALNTENIRLLQLPGNLLDRRFERAGVFALAAERGVTIHVRSVFLQGILLMKPGEVPSSMPEAAKVVTRVAALAAEFGLDLPTIALAFVRQGLPATRVLFGAETVEQVRSNLKSWQTQVSADLSQRIRDCFADISENVLNPTLWK